MAPELGSFAFRYMDAGTQPRPVGDLARTPPYRRSLAWREAVLELGVRVGGRPAWAVTPHGPSHPSRTNLGVGHGCFRRDHAVDESAELGVERRPWDWPNLAGHGYGGVAARRRARSAKSARVVSADAA